MNPTELLDPKQRLPGKAYLTDKIAFWENVNFSQFHTLNITIMLRMVH